LASAWGASWGAAWGDSWGTVAASTDPTWNCAWGQSWGNSWGDTSACVVTPPTDAAWDCAWGQSWGDSWGNTDHCPIAPPVIPPVDGGGARPTGGWDVGGWEFLRYQPAPEPVKRLVVEALQTQETARRAAQAPPRLPDTQDDAERFLQALEASLAREGIAWEQRYADLLRRLQARREAEIRAMQIADYFERERALALLDFELQAAQEQYLRNQNALRVLLMLM